MVHLWFRKHLNPSGIGDLQKILLGFRICHLAKIPVGVIAHMHARAIDTNSHGLLCLPAFFSPVDELVEQGR